MWLGGDGSCPVSGVAPRRRFHDGWRSPWVETHGYPHPVAPRPSGGPEMHEMGSLLTTKDTKNTKEIKIEFNLVIVFQLPSCSSCSSW
jgi:hypothetical protein